MKKSATFNLAATAMLMALIIVLMLTGLGYIPIGLLTLTILSLPVAVGTVTLGPNTGLFLGTIFGLTSFFTCFGMDAFGNFLLNVNPIFTFITCVIPRALCGWLPGLLFRWLKRWDKQALWSPALCCALTAALNTLLFLSTMWLLFGSTLTEQYSIASIAMLFISFAGVNALVEIAANLIVGGAVSSALLAFRRRQHI